MTRLEEKLALVTLRRKASSSATQNEEMPEPTHEQMAILSDAFDEMEASLERLLASADQSHELLVDSRREVRAATEILRWSNRFAAEREVNSA